MHFREVLPLIIACLQVVQIIHHHFRDKKSNEYLREIRNELRPKG